MKIFHFVCLLNLINVSVSVNILILAPLPSPSHYLWHKTLAFALADKGFNVTMFTANKHSGPKSNNYSEIQVEGIYEHLEKEALSPNEWVNINAFQAMTAFQEFATDLCLLDYESKGFQELISYPKDFKYDLIIVDIIAGRCILPIIEILNKPPTIATSAFLLPIYVSHMFGNHLHPSYIPWYGFAFTNHMNFIQRTWNFIFTYLDILIRNCFVYKLEEKAITNKLGRTFAWDELERHIGLVLANTDPILDYPQPLSPNIISVGGLQVKPPKKLPQDLQTLLDNAKNGFILFSLGTNIRSDKLDETTRKALITAFSKMPQLIVWKFESEIKNLPKNVIVRNFLPQNDILGHPNIKLFVTHGGALSSQEAVYHGVPLVVIPFFLDQKLNSKMIIHKEIGIEVNFHSISSDYIFSSVEEVIKNPKYTRNIKQLSQRFRDRPQTPIERALFWIEYVLRHGDVEFLSTPARDMPFYISSNIDIILFLTLSLVFILFVATKFIKVICNSLRPKIKKE